MPSQALETKAMESTLPFPETLQKIMDMQDVGMRELARRCEQRGWGSYASIRGLRKGEFAPTLTAMEEIAVALDIKPETFAEYRLGKARALLDPEQVGWKKALRNLKKLGL